jgi:ribonucleoside-triphosphate reductase
MKVAGKSGETDYDTDRVKKSIVNAFVSSNNVHDPVLVDMLVSEVTTKLKMLNRTIVTKDEVLDTIENTLMANRLFVVSQTFIRYRFQHMLQKDILTSAVGGKKLFSKYLDRTDWKVNENSNMSYSLQGLNNYIITELTAQFWLDAIYQEDISDAHVKGYMHLHDLGLLAPYCVGWDLFDLLVKGFGGVPGKIESAPPKHFGAALGQVVNFLFTLQGEAAGAQALSNFDTLLAPFIRHGGLTFKEVKQELQSFFFNMNVPTRVGGQSPFTNITLDLQVPKIFKDQPVIIGGVPTDDVYGDFQKEMDILNKALFEVMLAGDGKGRIFTFPIPTVNITKDFDWDAKNLETFWELESKYGVAYFCNYVNSDMDPEDSRSMCFSGNTPILYRNVKTGRICRTDLLGLYAKQEVAIEVPCNGKWLPATAVKVQLSKEKFMTVQLRTGVELLVTDNHQHLTKDGLKLTCQLTTDDYLAVSKKTLPWQGLGNYEFGKMLGWYLAEGSHCGTDTIQFSLGDKDVEGIKFLTLWFNENLGVHCSVVQNTGKSKSIFVNAEGSYTFISRFIKGKAKNKKLLNWWKLSQTCLQGLWDAWKEGDGSGNEIYTSSKELAQQMMEVANILGIKVNFKSYYGTSTLNDKTYTGWSYALNICTPSNKRGRIFFDTFDDTYYYVKVEKIKQHTSTSKVAYCVEMRGDQPYFELPSGVITHNCCRLRLDKRELLKRGGGLFGANALTGSIGVVTLNMPMLAYESNGSLDKFFTLIDKYMDKAKRSLEAKRKVLEHYTDQGLYPYSQHYLDSVKLKEAKYWANHFSTIGLVGLYEAAQNLMIDYTSPEGKRFAENTLTFMRRRLLEYQKDTGNLYNLEATPAEGTSYRLALLAKKMYPKLIASGTDKTPLFTNSSQLPVNYSPDLFKVLEHQDSLQSLYTGGTVLHMFLGETMKPNDIKVLVKKVFSNYTLPYLSITPTFSVCPTHGYIVGAHPSCPKCTEEKHLLTEKIKLVKDKLTK